MTNTTPATALSQNEKPPEPSKVPIEKHPEAAANPASCNEHFGYLSERGAKDPIPDECLTCMEIVQCMLKKAKDQVSVSQDVH